MRVVDVIAVDDFRVRAIGHTVSPVHQPSGAAGGNTASSSKSAGASVAAAGVALAKPASADGLQSSKAAAKKCRVYFESGWCDQTEVCIKPVGRSCSCYVHKLIVLCLYDL